MQKTASTITIHMVASLDGKVAKKDNTVNWFETTDHFENGVIGEDPEAFLKTIDCYVMGSKTYELALELSKQYGWAYGDKPTYVLTSKNLVSERNNIQFFHGGLEKLVNEILRPNYQNVWVVGGPALVKSFLSVGLVHEIRMTILPIILGEGSSFFQEPGIEQALHLKDTKAYKNGMVELCYEIKQ
jgi:dihydrofolate reductase